MLNTIGKYIVENHRDFYDSIQYLKENNVQDIKFNSNNDRDNHHNKFLIDFFKINKKNKIENMNLIFCNAKIEKKFYTTFSLSKLVDIKEVEENEFKQIEILFPYIKTLKYGKEMIEPLKQILQNEYVPYIHMNTIRDKQSLTIYKYFDDMNHELEIIETSQVSKNPFYGLVHYVNLDPYYFKNKYLVLQELETITVDKSKFKIIKDFFNIIETIDYTFSLDIKTFEKRQIYLSFNHNESKEDYQEILIFENFDIEFLLSIFKNFYDFEAVLQYLHLNNINIKLFFEEERINIFINDIFFEFEKNSKLITRFLRDFTSDYNKETFIQKAIYILKNEADIDKRVTIDDYSNYDKRKEILYIIKEKTK